MDFGRSPEECEKIAPLEWFNKNIAASWENMLNLKRDGFTREIGVSNFYRKHWDELGRHFPDQLPFANEIYCDICHQETEFIDYLQGKGVKVGPRC